MEEHDFALPETAALRILLLEDSIIDADLITRQLLKLGADTRVDRAVIRPEFERFLTSGPYDLVLSDYSLPDFNGLEALNVANTLAPGVPFIFVSGVIGEKFATEAVRAGATDYVTKRDLGRIPGVARRALNEATARAERAAAMVALQESEIRFQVMADSAPALIWATDQFGNFTFANRRFESEFATTTPELLQGGWDMVVHPDDRASFIATNQNALQRHSGLSAEVRVMGNDGHARWLRCEAAPRFSGSGQFLGHVGCAIDISEIRMSTNMLEAEVEARTRELEQKDEALRQAQKMEAIGQLTGGIAHDFNNMLAGIRGGADLLRKRLSSGRTDGLDRYVDIIMSSADRAAALTHRLLAFSRRQSLDLQRADLNELVTSLLELLQRTIGDAIEVEVKLEPRLWPALTDQNQFESALLNLAINARDAMPDGGTLSLITANVSVDARRARAFGIAPGDYVVTRVRDTGMGMSSDVIEKAFDPFFTTKPIGQGTGLGLSMIFGFAKQVGGHIRIESTPQSGTLIELYMPRDASTSIQPEHDKEDSMISAEGTGTILVVEDEVLVQMLVVDYLNDLGYETLEANDAKSALEIIGSEQIIDLLITDVGLPGMNGRELAERARQVRPNLKVLFATGYAEGATTRSGFLGAGMDMVAKPFDLDKFGEKVTAMRKMEFTGEG
ncbi:response regulator [Tianweitania sediminis]|uniref:histidine kinase n=1 Tax=Tianweitania sediminis TaxID=1502156 RepID=A0A8J7R361_9HYPH|nr:response regulator [Tianweitania sediminis]MBP0440837.1 response regulator [Tianweitania sediminis]